MTIEEAVKAIRAALEKGDKQRAREIIESLPSQGIAFPRIAKIVQQYHGPHKRWLWGEWGPEDDFVGTALASEEYSFLNTAGMLMSTEGMQSGRRLAADAFNIQGVMYSAMMEKTTCDLCASLDGQEFDYPSEDWERVKPPQHCWCACIPIWVAKEESNFEPTEDWEEEVRQSEYNKDKLAFPELIKRFGSANAWHKKSDDKLSRDALVTYNKLLKQSSQTTAKFVEELSLTEGEEDEGTDKNNTD